MSDWKNVQYKDGKMKTSSGGGGSSGHTYSTTEQVVGTWTNGKTLYEKTYEITDSFTPYRLDLSSIDIDELFIKDGYYNTTYSNSTYLLPLNLFEETNYYTLTMLNKSDKKLIMKVSGYTGVSAKVVLRYTKTTSQ